MKFLSAHIINKRGALWIEVVIVVVLLAMVAPSYVLAIGHLSINADAAVWLQMARSYFSEGLLPYRDIFDHKGPGLFVIYFLTHWLVGGWLPGFFVVEICGLLLSGLGVWWLLRKFDLSVVVRVSLIALIMLSLTSRIGSGLSADILVYVLTIMALGSATLLCLTKTEFQPKTKIVLCIVLVLNLLVVPGMLVLIRPFHGVGAICGVVAILWVLRANFFLITLTIVSFFSLSLFLVNDLVFASYIEYNIVYAQSSGFNLRILFSELMTTPLFFLATTMCGLSVFSSIVFGTRIRWLSSFLFFLGFFQLASLRFYEPNFIPALAFWIFSIIFSYSEIQSSLNNMAIQYRISYQRCNQLMLIVFFAGFFPAALSCLKESVSLIGHWRAIPMNSLDRYEIPGLPDNSSVLVLGGAGTANYLLANQAKTSYRFIYSYPFVTDTDYGRSTLASFQKEISADMPTYIIDTKQILCVFLTETCIAVERLRYDKSSITGGIYAPGSGVFYSRGE